MNDQESTSTGGILSKFQERLRKIRISRSKKTLKNQKFIDEKVNEIRNTLNEENKLGFRNVNHKKGIPSNTVIDKKKVDINTEIIKDDDYVNEVIIDIKSTQNDRNDIKEKLSGVREEVSIKDKEFQDKVEEIKANKPKYCRKKNRVILTKDDNRISNFSLSEKEELINNLGSEIMDKIKENFEDKLDELEVLTSELYFIKDDQDNEVILDKIKKLKERINILINEVNRIIEQYNLYNKSFYLEGVVGIDDSILVDDIITYRNLLDSFNDKNKFVKQYRALDEFKSLYNNLKEISNETDKLVKDNENKINKYDIRDKKYNNIKLEMVNVEAVFKKCSYEIEKQNEYFKELMTKINDIEKEEYVKLRLKGIDDLICGSLRYIGLMFLSPLRGLIPGIAMQTIATRRLIGNIYKNLHYETVRYIHYGAINYDSELNNHLSDVFYTEKLLDITYNDIEKLKEDFMRQYDSKIPGYDNTLKNILKIESKILHNQNKIEIIKKNLKRSKKLNENKISLVRKMNEEQK